MQEQLNNALLDARLALAMHRYAAVKEILGRLAKTALPRSGQVDYLTILGQAEIELREFEPAREHLAEALALLEDNPLSDPLKVEQVRMVLGHAYYDNHLFQQALVYFQRCRDGVIEGQIPDQRFKFKVFSSLASCYLGLKDYKHALKNYKEALTLATVGEDDYSRGSIYWGMGVAYQETGKLPSATSSLMRSVGIFERIGQKAVAARARGMLSEIMADRKMYDQSLKVIQEAVALAPPEDNLTLGFIYLSQGYTYLSMAAYEKALESNELSIAHARKVNDYLTLGQALTQMGRVYWGMQEGDQAIASFKEATAILKQTQDKIALSKAYRFLSDVAKEMGLIDEAFAALEAGYNV